MKKKHAFAAMLAALPAAAIIHLPGSGTVAIAAEQAGDLQAQGMAALKIFWTAIVAGTPQALDPVLAPEYQVERADGSGMDKAAYLKSELPKVAAVPEFASVNVTGTGDFLVVRYYVTVNQTRQRKVVQRHAPRLTVFRKQGDSWLAVAHANFAALAK